jgi:hypothetical protein
MAPMKKDHLEILLEDIRGKFELVLEGHESLSRKMDGRFDELNEKIEHNSFLIGTINKKIDGVDKSLSAKIDAFENSLGAKIDAVAADLAAHRADTEAHGPVYRVKESRD